MRIVQHRSTSARWTSSGASLEYIYGLPTNSPEEQKEADQGPLLAIRPTRRPFGSPAGGSHPKPEEKAHLRIRQAVVAARDMAFMHESLVQLLCKSTQGPKERVRWLKPAQFGGRPNGLELEEKVLLPARLPAPGSLGEAALNLAVTKKLASSSPTFNWVGAELGLVLEAQNMPEPASSTSRWIIYRALTKKACRRVWRTSKLG